MRLCPFAARGFGSRASEIVSQGSANVAASYSIRDLWKRRTITPSFLYWFHVLSSARIRGRWGRVFGSVNDFSAIIPPSLTERLGVQTQRRSTNFALSPPNLSILIALCYPSIPSFTAFLRSSMVLLPCTREHFFLHLEQFGFAQTTCLHLVDPLFSSL
jgi:hypothetical protein